MRRKLTLQDVKLAKSRFLENGSPAKTYPKEFWMNAETMERIRSCNGIMESSNSLSGVKVMIDNSLQTGIIETDIQRNQRLKANA